MLSRSRAIPKTDPGHVAFYDVDGELITSVKVGALPDMLTFTPNGQYVLVANEAEPSGYGVGHVDPQGSVSIIPVAKSHSQLKKLQDSDVRTASFTKFDGQEASLRAQGIRIYGPGSSASQDFEPEYITILEGFAHGLRDACRRTTRSQRSTSRARR